MEVHEEYIEDVIRLTLGTQSVVFRHKEENGLRDALEIIDRRIAELRDTVQEEEIADALELKLYLQRKFA